MFSRSFLVGVLALISSVCGLAVTPTPTQTAFYNSTTLTASPVPSPTAAPCCFVVLDTIFENWWEEVTTSTYYSVVNLTSITTLVTPYPTTTLTNFKTNVYTTNATFYFDVDVGQNPITMYTNDAPHPQETATILNGNGNVTYLSVNQNVTAVTTAGTTIHSPQAFWAYPSVRIITAEAVTNSAGKAVCATVSGFQSVYTEYSYTTVGTSRNSFGQASYTTFGTYTTTLDVPTFTVNSNVGNYYGNQTATQTGVVISLTTPFIYAPTRGANGASGEREACDQGPGSENYGYPVQSLLDYLVNNPFYSAQYPGLASCLPGGPDIIKWQNCSQASPAFEGAGGDLTSSTIITVTPTGGIPTAEPVSAASTTSPTETRPVATEPTVSTSDTSTSVSISTSDGNQPTISTSPTPTSVSISTTIVASFPGENPSSIPTSSPEPSTSQTESPSTESATSPGSSTPAASSTPITPTSPQTQTLVQESPSPPSNSQISPESQTPAEVSSSPTSNSPTLPESQTSAQESPSLLPGNSPNPNSALPPSPSDSSSAIAAAIASAIGASPITALPTVISGTSDFVISGETTIPVNPDIPLSGSTTVISGVTNVIISAATTVPVSQVIASAELVGSTTLVSGTLNVVVAGAGPTTIPVGDIQGISGSTVVLGGSTYVVVETPETVPVVLGNPTGTGSGFASPSGSSGFGANSTAPLQFISAGSRYGLEGSLALSLSFALTACGVRLLF